MVRTGTIQFYLGPRGSGTQPHWHGSSWNWLVHGRKAWQLWPPAEASYAQQHVALALEQGGRGAADVEMLPDSLQCEQVRVRVRVRVRVGNPNPNPDPVSYTHLTLPTILLV